jgi:hypothetical protein
MTIWLKEKSTSMLKQADIFYFLYMYNAYNGLRRRTNKNYKDSSLLLFGLTATFDIVC